MKVNEKVKIPLFNELGNSSEMIEFIVVKFHNFYHGLIGNDILKRLNAIIDYKNNQLNIDGKLIPLIFGNKTEHKVNISVEQEEGLAYVKEQKSLIGNVIIKEGVYNIENHKLEAEIKTTEDCIIPPNIGTVYIEEVNYKNFNVIEEKEFKPIQEQLRINHLNGEETQVLFKLIRSYSEIFHQENCDLTFTNAIKHQIRTLDNIPIFTKSYRYPYIHKTEVETQIQEMLRNKIIRHSNSPYSAPIWIVPKKVDASGKQKWRLVIDYRKLNEITIDDKYPIPNIDEILDKLGRCQYFTTLDLAKGFHQIEIDEKDVHKTAFSVENGHYEFLRMPFGLKTAPATFQRLMNNVLHDYINKICLVYLDDIIIFSTSLQEHMESLRRVFQRLKEVNLKVQLDKSEFLKKETEFLGHIVTETGIKPNPKKIECVLKFPIPKTPKQIKQFLGLTGYYRKFMKDYSMIAKPMTRYLQKNAKINIHNQEYEKSFETLKNLLTNDPILRYPDFEKEFTLTTDASNFALGAVLSQEDHPICYASRTLNVHEQNYSTIEKELLAIVWATKYFRTYLFGRKFTIETDHKPLQWLFSLKEPCSKLVRWRLKLSEFDYKIKYKKGTKNSNADALSRIEKLEEVNTLEEATEQEQNSIRTSESAINIFKNQIIIQKSNSGSLRIKNIKIFNNSRKIISVKVLDTETAITLLKNHFNPNQLNAVLIDDELFDIFNTTFEQTFSTNIKFKIIRCFKLLQDIQDEEILAQKIEKEHKNNNHRGIEEVFKELKNEIYHPNLRLRITKFINNCEICNIEKYNRHPPKPPYKLTETPSRPNEIIHIDVFYTLEKKLFMTIIDKFTKFAQAYHINGRTWTEFKTKLLQYIGSFGKINKIIVDNELGFKAIPIREFLEQENIDIHYTSNSNHTSNADIERLHNTMNEHIRLLRHDEKNESETVEDKILRVIKFYNNTIHSTTNRKPIDFINGKIPESEYPEIHDRITKIKEKIIGKLNQNRSDVLVEAGPNFIKEIRGGKNHARYRKIVTEKLDDDHIIDTKNRLKYYKTHVKPKKKFEDKNNPTTKAKTKSYGKQNK